ncbi:hypothetical protein HXX76_006820 [Chlamydomonas incerta]|uniref:Uncharacterized protein n=1 Tax=Chlamydomonas incerta TaxID=51695 RepID=A0A835T244_CHLIN|nr:hypothetical protein HXX76_006820 [Chlamydomonas incerta]|eukprot:KAG2435617.1 hypothetical protein HXX76_006820 [Chlamydomonas incerta]
MVAARPAALQAVAGAMGGGLPDELSVSGPSWNCTLQMRPRCQIVGGDRVAAAEGRGVRGTGGAGATAAPAAVLELTSEQLLERAADKVWTAASVQGVASMAEAAMDAYVAAGTVDSDEQWICFSNLENLDVLLRGPFVWQLTAMAVVPCDYCPFAALQLYRAAAAAARKTPSCLQVSAARPGGRDCWSSAIEEVIRELWEDHLSPAPQPAVAAARAAAAGAAVGAGGHRAHGGGGGGSGGGGPAKTNAAGADEGPGRAPGGQPAGGEAQAEVEAEPGGELGPGSDAPACGGGGNDLQVLMHLLLLLAQAQAAVVRLDLDTA